MRYYYLAASLMPLEFGDISELNFLELVDKYSLSLTEASMKALQVVRLYFDLENLRQTLASGSEPLFFDTKGNLSQQELKEALEQRVFFAEYVYDFLDSYKTPKEAYQHFPSLLSTYYQKESEKAEGFLKEYLEFERGWRLIATGYRAKKEKKDVVKELEFEDPKDPLVAAVLSQKDSPHFEAPFGYEELQEMLLTSKNKPMYQYRQLAEFRFRKVREMVASKSFSLDYLLSYAIRVIILEDLHKLSAGKGSEILNSIVKDSA
ncbi:MAG: DUF2764 family protein [Chlamydiae bacterium]|nr:DUF2764 family protein [Chlamydiota bacterium]